MSPSCAATRSRPQPWANGGGTTRELARADDGAWRISLADIDADGPFSAFPGRHRLLTVVDGPVLGLEVDGETHVVEPQRPFAFAGDAAVVATVPEGAVRVLNVIVDPEVVAPFVTVLELGRTSVLPLADDQAAYVLKGDDGGPGASSPGPARSPAAAPLAVVTLQRADRPATPARPIRPGRRSRTATVTPGDRFRVEMMRATARFTVSYGDELRFAGRDLPAPDAGAACRRATARCRSTSTDPRRVRCPSTCTSTAAPS